MGRALVLSGGGTVGIAWESGLAAGLASKGVALSEADFIVGTSAGSAVGARLALGHDLSAVMARYRNEEPQRTSGTARSGDWLKNLMTALTGVYSQGGTPEEIRAAIGKFALEADTAPEDRFVAGFALYLQGEEWPEKYRCTSIDALTGEFVVWDRASGAPLERAVASSCAVPGLFPPITVNGRRYIDGGMRSGTNADLAVGHEKVLIVALSSGARAASAAVDPTNARAAQALARMSKEREKLEASGATVEVIGPDEAAADALGGNLMDPRLAPAAAEAGFRQGEAIAAEVETFWAD